MTTEEQVIEIIADVVCVDVEDVTLNAHLEHDLGADSLDREEIAMAIEDKFEIEFSDEQADELVIVSDLIGAVVKLKGK